MSFTSPHDNSAAQDKSSGARFYLLDKRQRHVDSLIAVCRRHNNRNWVCCKSMTAGHNARDLERTFRQQSGLLLLREEPFCPETPPQIRLDNISDTLDVTHQLICATVFRLLEFANSLLEFRHATRHLCPNEGHGVLSTHSL